MNCYYCKDYLNKETELEGNHDPYGFCDEDEAKLWGDKTYGKQNKGTNHPVEYMQKRLNEMAEETRLRSLKTK